MYSGTSLLVTILLLIIVTASADDTKGFTCSSACNCVHDTMDNFNIVCEQFIINLTNNNRGFSEGRIECRKQNNLIYSHTVPANKFLGPYKITFSNCPLPGDNETFKTILENFQFQHILSLTFENNAIGLGNKIRAAHFKELTDLIELKFDRNGITELPKDLFQFTTNIQQLTIVNNEISSLTDFDDDNIFSNLKHLTYINLGKNAFTTLPENLFSQNKNLIEVHLDENKATLKAIPSGFLADKHQLKTVSMRRCGLESLPNDWLRNSRNIKLIDLRSNNLSALNDSLTFGSQINLQDLRLSYNNLEVLSNDLFQHTRSLRKIDLSNNKIKDINKDHFRACTNLQQICLQHNLLTYAEDAADDLGGNKLYEIYANLTELMELDLSRNEISSISYDWPNRKLGKLDLSYNRISAIDFTENAFRREKTKHGLKIDLSHNQIRTIVIKEEDCSSGSDHLFRNLNIDLNNNPLHCNCKIWHLMHCLKNNNSTNFKIDAENLECGSPPNIEDRKVSRINMTTFACLLDTENTYIELCPPKCTCSYRSFDNGLIVNCSNAQLTEHPNLDSMSIKPQTIELIELYIEGNNITQLADLRNSQTLKYVTKLYARKNFIKEINRNNLPQNLTEFDLRENRMVTLDVEALETAYVRNGTLNLTSIYLSENRWYCDCNFGMFVRNYSAVRDAPEIECDNCDKVMEVPIEMLCPIINTMDIIMYLLCTLLVVMVLSSIIGSFFYKFKQEVKIWLYAHKCCLWCVSEEELDKDKEYDAFISYSQFDVDVIREHFIPELEESEPQYKLCLHERDWEVGAFITDSVFRSIDTSRRTIVILSANFLQSVWGKFEFQIAYTNAIAEGRVRVIVVIYGDIGDFNKLDPLFKMYLRSNTYVQWGDPWFWKKIRYALPHRDGGESDAADEAYVPAAARDPNIEETEC